MLENLGIKFLMDAGEFEGLLYNIFSEEPFNNHRYDITDEKDDYTISNYFFSEFRHPNRRNMGISYLSCNKISIKNMTHLLCH